MTKRRRFKHSTSFKERLATFAKDVRDQAEKLKPGPEKESLLLRARQADAAADLDEWANSPGLQAPK